jgi:hypothetical protein
MGELLLARIEQLCARARYGAPIGAAAEEPSAYPPLSIFARTALARNAERVSPPRSADRAQQSGASTALRNALSMVSPPEVQPGRSGTTTPCAPDAPSTIAT